MSATEVTNVNPNLRKLVEAGTSPWLDLLQRSLVEDGELARLVAEDSLRGVTSNPSIFEKSILHSDDYDEQLHQLFDADSDMSAQAIYEELAIHDVRGACDVLRQTYEDNHHQDGFVSLEVAADLAHDPAKTITAAKDFWKRVDRPNLMIKIPGTKEGVGPIEEAIVRSREAQLEIAPPLPLGAQAGAGPICAAQIHEGAVDDHDLEVHARTGAQRERAFEAGALGQRGAEGPRRWRGVQDRRKAGRRRYPGRCGLRLHAPNGGWCPHGVPCGRAEVLPW